MGQQELLQDCEGSAVNGARVLRRQQEEGKECQWVSRNCGLIVSASAGIGAGV